jgi:glycosyltransferase involved in cell wall biosynthesis
MLNHEKIPEILSMTDICVNPSIQEGMATANLEAMASGACMVATRGVGNDEVIEEGINGFLYSPKDIKDLASKLKKLISDKRLRDNISQEAIKTIEDNFSNDIVIKKYIEQYEELIR